MFRLVICQLVGIGKIPFLCPTLFWEAPFCVAGAGVDSGFYLLCSLRRSGAIPLIGLNCGSWERPMLVIPWVRVSGDFRFWLVLLGCASGSLPLFRRHDLILLRETSHS